MFTVLDMKYRLAVYKTVRGPVSEGEYYRIQNNIIKWSIIFI